MALTKIPPAGLEDTGVGAGTVGSASQIPVITVNAQGQVIAKGTAALDLSVKVSKTGDTMTGNLAIQNTAPTINLVDIDNAVSKAVHHNSDLIGFLGNQGQWIQNVNNSGQISTPAYGWLHDRFAHVTPLANQGATGDHGVRNYLGNVTVWQAINCGYEVFNAGGGQHQVRYYIQGYNVTVNCDCNCNCGTCCFPLDTMLTMVDGAHKRVDEMVAGDKVRTAFGDYATVLEPIVCPVEPGEVTVLINQSVRMTREHLLRGTEGWLAVDRDFYVQWLDQRRVQMPDIGVDVSRLRNVEIGDVLITEGGPIRVESIERVVGEAAETLMSIELDGDRSFFANGYAVESKAQQE